MGTRGPKNPITGDLVCGPETLTDEGLARNRSDMWADVLAHPPLGALTVTGKPRFRPAESAGLAPALKGMPAYDNLAIDGGGYLTYLAPTRANLSLAEERWPDIRFNTTREH